MIPFARTTVLSKPFTSIAMIGLMLMATAGCQPDANRISQDDPQATDKEDAAVPAIAEAEFDRIISSDQLTLVKFGAVWCGPCRAVDDELKTLDGKLDGVEVVKVDVDANPDLATRYEISGIPKLMLVRGGEVIDDKVGYASADQLISWVDANR